MDLGHNGFVESDLDANGRISLESPKVVTDEESDVDDESRSLLDPKKGGMERDCEKPRRKVSWLDDNGDKLAEILEFQPSDMSDSDDEESDSCICRIM